MKNCKENEGMKENTYNIHFENCAIPDMTIRATSKRVARQYVTDIIRKFIEDTGYDAEFSSEIAKLYKYTLEKKGERV